MNIDDLKPLTPIPTSSIPNKLYQYVNDKNDTINIDNFKFASALIEYNDNDEITTLLNNSSCDELLLEKFNYYSIKIGKIVRISEIINYDIETIIRIYLQKHKLKDITSRKSKYKDLKEYENTYNFDFMKFSKLLSCIINTDTDFEVIERLNSEEKRKNFTRKLYNFIINRNYYTHGYLFIRIPLYQPLISIVYKNADHYILINDDIIEDHFKAFLNLKSILTDITKVCSGVFKNFNNL